jgi:hypothetical protein
VLISPGPDGELMFTRKPAGDGYLVSTNFNATNPEHGYGYPCWRYETAQGMLGDLIESGDPLTAERAAGVLDAVHQDGGSSWTIASLVADLPNGLIYLTYFYQFDRPVVLSVADELAHPRAPGPLSALFPEDVQREAARRYARIQRQADRCRWAGMAWIGSVLACTLGLAALLLRRRLGGPEPGGMAFWIVLVLVLGPLGFLVWLIVGRTGTPPPQPSPADADASRRISAGEGEEGRAPMGVAPSPVGGPPFLPSVNPRAGRRGSEGERVRWRTVLLEAAGDIAPTTVAYAAYLALALSLPAVMGSASLQAALILGLPLALGWLAFQGPLLARAAKTGYVRVLWRRLPHALVAANLGLAGTNLLAAPLVHLSTGACSLFPRPGWSVGILWAVVVAGALVGVLLLCLYEWWAARRGLAAWRVVAAGDGEVRSGSWRQLWWWVLLSYLALVGGVSGSAVLQQLVAA